jgi:hypothetical protein
MRRTRDRRNSSRPRAWRVASVVVATLLVSGLVSAQERGRCLTVDVPAVFVTPDRVAHEPGALKLCVARIHSPVSVLHKLYIDGHMVGMLQSRTGLSEGPASSEPYVQFHWNGRGQMLLVGYAWPEGDRMRTHILSCGGGYGSLSREACIPSDTARKLDEGFILTAARVN